MESQALGGSFPAASSCVSLTDTSQEALERPCGERMSWLKLELTGPRPRVPGAWPVPSWSDGLAGAMPAEAGWKRHPNGDVKMGN